jgi:hypothetical protein
MNENRMAVGDFDWQEVEHCGPMAILLFFTYLALATILLLNLLIAMLNESYEQVVEKAQSEYLSERASIILSAGAALRDVKSVQKIFPRSNKVEPTAQSVGPEASGATVAVAISPRQLIPNTPRRQPAEVTPLPPLPLPPLPGQVVDPESCTCERTIQGDDKHDAKCPKFKSKDSPVKEAYRNASIILRANNISELFSRKKRRLKRRIRNLLLKCVICVGV